ncbi:MAG: DUF1732 domain-containing protein [Oscillospiraceae bacterium]
MNNRYLDCGVKLPRVYSFAEDPVKKRIKAAVTRGKVDAFVTVTALTAEPMQISLNRPVLEGYLQALRQIAGDYDVKDDISVSTLARFSDIFLVEKADSDEAALTAALLGVVDTALQAYNAMRETRAPPWRRTFAPTPPAWKRWSARSSSAVRRPSGNTAPAWRKMREVLSSTTIDESRILTEAAIFADKVAVDEETVCLRSHLSQLRKMIEGGGAIGRKLDFLMQEMNRVANTIGSKASDLQQAQTVVEIKAELEKIREQMQNIE